ncbi:MAG: SAP domain-containing protein [Treponema sp.]
MAEKRPDFEDIKSFEEFNNYYWYREELSQICESMGLAYRGTKQELNSRFYRYLAGN